MYDTKSVLEKEIGDLSQWIFTGNIAYNDEHDGLVELPRCVCGHPIVYSHEIQNTTTHDVAYVGSECIKYFRRKFVRVGKPYSLARLRAWAKIDAIC